METNAVGPAEQSSRRRNSMEMRRLGSLQLLGANRTPASRNNGSLMSVELSSTAVGTLKRL